MKKKILDTDVPASACLGCGRMNDMAMGISPETKPHPGCFTVCIDCRHIMVFAEDLTMRNPTGKEMIDMAGNMDLLKTIAVLRFLGKIK